MLKNIPFVDLKLQHQPLKAELENSIQEVLERGDFILGQAVEKLESSFPTVCGVKNGVGVGCGTDAIALGLQACGIGAGDEVILPANTFVATLIGVLQAGATPVLVDCNVETALIDLEAAQKAVTSKTKVILPVHLYGQMVSPSELKDFAEANNLIIFEDAAQAHLAEREGYCAGSIGTAAAFSFYPSKNLGSFGDGGMVVTRDSEIAKKIRTLRNYGAPRKYVHEIPGTNSRLDSIQAAILNVKLPYLKDWNSDRNQAAQKYDILLSPMKEKGIIPIKNLSGTGHIYHLYVIRVTDKSPINRDTLKEKLGMAGISTGIHYPIPCHLQPAYQNLGYKQGDFPNSESLSQEILSLPIYPVITEEQIHQVAETISQIIM
ncbi:DegT/DnrJ/EryC1/StrS aminotransferase family protein [Okeania sp.]|uniref:DegT/DnrJ/EryC1/StrS family aminotransferase n=1 Tax=Okeania sp. TaxID=3100323 RepID=UPI002B4B2DBB|nr:DegT/DnrJ/EryC1/StrS aminotransferase family protein [Okeania sp.]MEB3343537.1 DegT/DnrJ/EryC1/StrS aminotransferase family protein [Okeania sp.]